MRKKSDRRNLKGVECLKCGEVSVIPKSNSVMICFIFVVDSHICLLQFFDAAFDNPNQKLSVVNDCSRHRSKHGLRSRSPKGKLVVCTHGFSTFL